MAIEIKIHKKSHPQPLPSNQTSSIWKKEIWRSSKKLSSKQKEILYHEFSILTDAGISLKDGIRLIIDNIANNSNREIIEAIQMEIIAGKSVYQALKQSKSFTPYEYESVKIGEETGRLNDVFNHLADYYQSKNKLRRDIISALVYPTILLVTAILVILFMLNFVVPMFEDIFKQNNMELPSLTLGIIALSNTIRIHGIFWLSGSILIIFLHKYMMKKPRYKEKFSWLLLKLPLVGSYLTLIHMSRFTQAITLMTKAGIPLLQSIILAKGIQKFDPLITSLDKVEQEILKGKSLSESLQTSPLFDNKMIAMIKVAEETNKTAYVFEKLDAQYRADLSFKSKNLSTVLEPAIILTVGFLIGVILIAMYIPMFKIGSALG